LIFEGVPSILEKPRPVYDRSITGIGIDNKRLSMNCLQVSIPDASFTTSDFQVVGPKRAIPQNQNFGDNNASFQFNCGTDLYEYNVFRSWQRSIVDPVSRYVAYYDDYAKNCSITVVPLPNNVYNYNYVLEMLANNRLYGIKMTEVYPRSVGVNQLQNASTNALMVSSVSFGYRELVPHYSWDDDLKYFLYASIMGFEDTITNTARVADDQLRGIRDISVQEAETMRSSWLAKPPIGAKIDAGRPNYDHYIKPNRKDPSGLPPYAGEPDLFLNNLITSGINTTALFRGI
jgi:hypothetical protein